MDFFTHLEQECGTSLSDSNRQLICSGLTLLSNSLKVDMTADLERVAAGDPFLPHIRDYYKYRSELHQTNLKETVSEVGHCLRQGGATREQIWGALIKGLMRANARRIITRYEGAISTHFAHARPPPIPLYDMYRYLYIVVTLGFPQWEHDVIINMLKIIDYLVLGIGVAERTGDVPGGTRKYLLIMNNHNWHRDRRFLLALCTVVARGMTSELNLTFNDVFQLALRTLLDRPSRRREWDAALVIQRAVRKFIYQPGMGGSSRSADAIDLQNGRLRPEEAEVPILSCRTAARRLVNRMSRRELLEILRAYGKDHGFHVSS